ncbi:hypothetical protein EDD15DRAFT_931342 [Pisolithus albus]|nr:hypothetical protein EDD15DRAFT_931342 [Pisolithus albus]
MPLTSSTHMKTAILVIGSVSAIQHRRVPCKSFSFILLAEVFRRKQNVGIRWSGYHYPCVLLSAVTLSYPVILSLRSKNSYFKQHESFSFLGMFQNPMMVLMLAASMMLATPYIMERFARLPPFHPRPIVFRIKSGSSEPLGIQKPAGEGSECTELHAGRRFKV